MRVADFMISDVQPKEHTRFNPTHEEVLGTPCYIEDAGINTRGLLMYKPDYSDRFHRLHISAIKSIHCSEGEKIVTLETMNTTYTLTRINFDPETYGGIPCMTEEDAESFIRRYVADGAGKRLMETIYKDQEIDMPQAVSSLMNAVKWLGEKKEDAIYHVFWDALYEKDGLPK